MVLGEMTFSKAVFYLVAFIGMLVSFFTLTLFVENSSRMHSPRIRKYKKISVIIPAYNEEKNIGKVMKKTLACDYPKDLLELIVVDDGSTDGTYRFAKSLKIRNLVVLRKPNGGKASAVNFGIRHATGEYVMVLDADTFPERNVFMKSVGYFEDPDVMAVGIAHRVHNPRNLLEKMQVIEYAVFNFARKLLTYRDSLTIAAAGSVFRKSFFDRHGGFDEDNLTEDFEMTMRIQSKNYRVANSIDTYVETVVPDTLAKLKKQRIRWMYGGTDNMVRKYSFMISPKYGDLGVFILPLFVVGITIIPIATFYYLFIGLNNLLKEYYMLYLIGFDVKYTVTNFILNIPDLGFHFRYYVAALLLLMGFSVYFMSVRKSDVKVNPAHWILFLFYSILVVYYTLHAGVLFLLGKRPKWH